jgi:hypothetical protein
MTSNWRVRVILVSVVVVGLLSMMTFPLQNGRAAAWGFPLVPATQAYPGENNEVAALIYEKSAVWGYVWDYSTGMRQGNVTVFLEGDGWRLETISDSNGYYRFGDLGIGDAVLYLALPREAHSVTDDYFLSLGSRQEYVVNLGYYWGDEPSIPVLLSAGLQSNTLVVEVNNNTTETATGLVVDVRLPNGVTVSSQVSTSQGLADLGEDGVQVGIGDIPAGEAATIRVPFGSQESYTQSSSRYGDSATRLRAAVDAIQVVLEYDQQMTPQVASIDPANGISQAAAGSGPGVIPQTGDAQTTNVTTILLALALILGLGVAGWSALGSRK